VGGELLLGNSSTYSSTLFHNPKRFDDHTSRVMVYSSASKPAAGPGS
jgi:hypothetical protein